MEAINLKRLLVVDNDIESKDEFTTSLKKHFELSIIDNVSEALDYSESEVPDVILLDLDMPQVDGFELLNRLDAHPVLCDVPVISMTDERDEKYAKRAYREGSSGMIYKPIKPENLARDIEGVLKRVASKITSTNQRIVFHVEFSEKDRNKKIKQLIREQEYENEPMIFLSWSRGEDFLGEDEDYNRLIINDQLLYLEVKPSVISKFPYLQDVTPMISEMKQFLGENSRKYHLVFEEVGYLFSRERKEKSISQALNLAQLLHSEFKRVTYVNAKPEAYLEAKFLGRIGGILAGVRN